jgi:DNA-binding protein YbaB
VSGKNHKAVKEKVVKKYFDETSRDAKRFPRLTLTTLLVAIAILGIAAVAFASRQRQNTSGPNEAERNMQAAISPHASPDLVTVRVAGHDVQVNSQTGQIQALTPEEAQKIAAGLKQMVNQSTEGLVQAQQADGSVSIDLKGRFQNVTVARVNKDGSISQSCVDNPQAAGAFFGINPKLIENQSNDRAVVNQRPKFVKKTAIAATPNREYR